MGEITPELVRKWRLWLARLGTNISDELQVKTQSYHLIALRMFLKFCAKRDIPALAADKIELPKLPRHNKITFLTIDELGRLFEQPDITTEIGLRDRAILELLFSSGLRVSELVSLDRDHVNLKRREFMVRGKGQRTAQSLSAKRQPTGLPAIWTSVRTTLVHSLSATMAPRQSIYPVIFTA